MSEPHVLGLPRDVAHWLVWWLLVAAPAVLLAWQRPRGPARLLTRGVPALLLASWLHGVAFDPPNNWARVKAYGFFGFWFQPHRWIDVEDLWAWMLTLGAVGVGGSAVLAWLGSRPDPDRVHRAWAAAAWVAWTGVALLARSVPDELLDVRRHRTEVIGDVLEETAPHVLAVVLAGAPVAAVALLATLLALRPRAQRSASA